MFETGGWLHHTKTIDKTLPSQRESSRLYMCFFDLLLSETAFLFTQVNKITLLEHKVFSSQFI